MEVQSLASDLKSTSQSSWVMLLFLGVVAVIFWTRFGAQKRNLPPGPRNWPLIGALLQMEQPRLHRAFTKLATRYGPIVHFRLGVQTMVLVSSAEAAEHLLKQRDADFADRSSEMTKIAGKYAGVDGSAFPWADNTSELKLSRKIFAMELFTGSKLKSYEGLRRNETAVMVDKIFREIETSKNKECQNDSPCAVGIRNATLALMHNVIFKLCTGERFDDLAPTDEIRDFPEFFMNRGVKLIRKFNLLSLLPFLKWLDPRGTLNESRTYEKRFNGFIEMIVEKQRQVRKVNSKSKDGENELNSSSLVEALLSANEDGSELSQKGVLGAVATLLMAGIHPVGSQVEWTLLELVRHPHLLRRLRDEIDGVVGKERPLQEADLQSLPFLNAVALESMRLHPVFPFSFPHVNKEPSTLGGYYIPPKTAIMVNILSIGRDPQKWKNSLQFNPERFMGGESCPLDPALSSKPGSVTSGSNFNIIPFGSGRRICSGATLAMTEVLTTIGTLVHAFEWTPLPGCSAEDLSIEEDFSFVMHPVHELFLTPKPRLSREVYTSIL